MMKLSEVIEMLYIFFFLGGGYTLDPCILMYANYTSIKNE